MQESERALAKNTSRNIWPVAWKIAFGLLLAFICGEIFLRLILGNCAVGKLIDFNSGQKPCVVLKPDASVRHTGLFKKIPPVVHSVNRFGYRGAARERIKPEGAYRVIVVGDSFTFCPGVADGSDYPSRLEFYLKQSGMSVAQVLNFGVPGLNLEEVDEHIRRRALDFYPDFIIAQIAQNDFDRSMCANLSYRRRASEIFSAHSYLARALFIFGEEAYEDTAAHDERVERVGRFAGNLADLSRESGVGVTVVGFHDPLELGNEFMERLLAQRGIPYFPLPESMEQYLTLDVGHLSEQGCDQYGRSLADWLVEELFMPVQ